MIRFHHLLAFGVAALAGPVAAQTGPVVNAPSGAVRGSTEGDLRVFKGIPYAQPPVHALRWRAPVAMARWQDVRAATEFGAACIQPAVKAPNIYSGDPMPTSEDCLTLNIWGAGQCGQGAGARVDPRRRTDQRIEPRTDV
ncbi:MAG: carboxylesterase family protein [Candidatus Sphingomonas colombiensis]|nr:carboxylesterase family protein [Sphingomonas sp.]WEK43752.1 MAG: carboxylesterase family protein [Sphingomonas sp.]